MVDGRVTIHHLDLSVSAGTPPESASLVDKLVSGLIPGQSDHNFMLGNLSICYIAPFNGSRLQLHTSKCSSNDQCWWLMQYFKV